MFALLVLFQISLVVSKETCFGSICYDIQPSCLGLSLSLSYNSRKIIDQQIDISTPFCQTIYGECKWCANATNTENTVRYCYETQNCQGSNSNGRCFDMKTNCNNHGKCLVGGCQCDAGYYGVDCSLLIKDNCVQTSNDKLCWKLHFPDCNTVNLELSSQSAGVVLRQNSSIKDGLRFPCQAFPNLPDCKMCIVVNHLGIAGDTLIGSPIITLCGTRSYEIGSIPLVKTSSLANCPSTFNFNQPTNSAPTSDSEAMPQKNEADSSDTGKTLLVVLSSLLGLVFVGGVGYYVITKHFSSFIPNTFQDSVEVYEDDDIAPLTQNTDD